MKRRWKVLLIVSVGNVMTFLDLFVVNIAFPDISRSFPEAGLATLSWVLSAYTIVLAALLVPAGRWADRIGRKRVFIAGLVVFTLASIASAAAPSVDVLIAARVAQAVGGAMMIPSSLGLILPEFPADQQLTAVGAWAAVGAVAAAAGPPVGGLLVEASWHWVFLINVPIGLGTVIASFRVLDEWRDPTADRRPDVIGATLLAFGIGALVLAIIQGPDWGWASSRVVGSFSAALVLLALVMRRSGRHPEPVVEPAIVRVRSFAIASAALLIFSAAFSAFLLGGVLFLTTVWKFSVLTAGLALAPAPLVAALVAVLASALEERFGQRLIGVVGALLYAGGGAWLALTLGPEADYMHDVLPALILAGMGAGFAIPAMMTTATSSLPGNRLATGTAVMVMSRQIGSAIGVAILIAILGSVAGTASSNSYVHGWLFVALSAAAAALVCSTLTEGPRQSPAAEPPSIRVEAEDTSRVQRMSQSTRD